MSGRHAALFGAVLMAAVLGAGCGRTTVGAPAPSPSSSTGSPSPVAQNGETALTIVVDDGSASTTTWRLSCDPPGGTHPDTVEACRVLAAHGKSGLAEVPENQQCTQVYGGPQRASVTGTWQGQQVASTLSRTDGCEISRWNLLLGLLPPATG